MQNVLSEFILYERTRNETEYLAPYYTRMNLYKPMCCLFL